MRTLQTEQPGGGGLSVVWQCVICSKIVKYKNNLKEHIIGQHHDNDFYCTQCGKILKTKAALRMHVKRQHTSANIVSAVAAMVAYSSNEIEDDDVLPIP